MSSGIAADDGDQAPRRSARLAGSSPTSLTELSRRTLCFVDTITVRVGRGSEAVDFTVHEHKSRAISPFFKAALSKAWQEGREKSIKLPEDDPDIFDMFMYYMYGGKNYEVFMGGKGPHRIVHSYVFGEKVSARDYQNALMAALLLLIHSVFLVGDGEKESAIMHLRWMVDIFYTRSPPTSPGQKVTADYGIASFKKYPTSIKEHAWTVEFMKDIAARTIKNGADAAIARSERHVMKYFVTDADI